MKVLLSAFACSPELGSEPGVGWGFVKQIAKKHRVWVLTAVANQSAIEQALAEHPLPDVHFVFVGLHRHSTSFAGKSWLHHIYYLLWQFQVYRVARSLHRVQDFDLVHHLTYVNSWMPSLLGWLRAPFLWSAGTKDRSPLPFIRDMSWKSQIWELSRNALIGALGPFTQFVTALHASLILTSSELSLWSPSLPVKRCLLGALSTEEIDWLGVRPISTPHSFRMASIGRLMGLKGYALGLRAFARVQGDFPWSEYVIIGNGPERDYLGRLAADLGCAEKVRFVDWLPRGQLFQLLNEVDVLIHPSLHEQFSYVILECMAAGIPVICLDVGGPSLLVGTEYGFKIPVSSPSQVVDDICRAICRLAQDPECRIRMGEEARTHANRAWNWEVVGEKMLSLYKAVHSRETDDRTTFA
jgi:glycosyltransferase involved in cell wall biosynthesis